MSTIIVRAIQTKQKVGCKYCGRFGNPPRHEVVEEDDTIYYICENHLGWHLAHLTTKDRLTTSNTVTIQTQNIPPEIFHPTQEQIEAEDDFRERYDGKWEDRMSRDEG